MNLSYIVKNLEYLYICGDINKNITNLTIDSRKVIPGSMFFCIKGFTVDGHEFVTSAIQNGAASIICEEDLNISDNNITIIKVKNTRKALAEVALKFYNNPTSKVNLIGITGTNGKTSSTYFIETILNQVSQSVGVIGTIETRAFNKKLDFEFATSTTPDTIELNELFNKMIDMNVKDIIIEVSSHALELNKLDGCKFNICIFTNLTQDHLDLHQTMQDYCLAKSKLFTMCEVGVINVDDEYSNNIIKNSTCKILKFSIHKESDLQAVNINYLMDKVIFDVKYKEEIFNFELNMPGKFSVYNALGAIGASIAYGIPMQTIQAGIKNIKGVPGRIQNIPNDKGFNVFVDYAHTPDGLENIIKSVKNFTKGRVITVFGCGGDRDRKKRPLMAEISGNLSDYTIITSDNPRSETPEDIIKEIEQGIKNITKNYETITERRNAIFKAVKMAKPLDSIIIAGKGHEKYEIFADRTIHFDDTEEAKKALEWRSSNEN